MSRSPRQTVMASKKCLELFYDIMSPYSWFAFEVLCRYQSRWNISVKLRPFYLPAIFHGSDNRPPSMVSAKMVYFQCDLARLRKYYQIPMELSLNQVPNMLFKGSLKPMRFLTALEVTRPDKLEDMTRELWTRVYSKDVDITEEENLSEAGAKIGLSSELIQSLLSSIKEKSIKDRLSNTTQEALDLGVFGAPAFVMEVNGEKEWVFGGDRFPVIAEMLGEKWEGPNPGVSSKF